MWIKLFNFFQNKSTSYKKPSFKSQQVDDVLEILIKNGKSIVYETPYGCIDNRENYNLYLIKYYYHYALFISIFYDSESIKKFQLEILATEGLATIFTKTAYQNWKLVFK